MRQALIALALTTALCLTGCTAKPEPPAASTAEPEPTATSTPATPKTPFTLSYYADTSLHPIIESSRATQVISGLVYECLFELDNTFTPHKVLCKDYSVSEDGLIWTFTLTDAVFSDNTPLISADVVTSLELARRSTRYAPRFTNIRSISVGTDERVVINLLQPNNSLPALLDIPILRDPEDGSMPLGTGAYRFVEDDGPLRLLRTDTAPSNVPAEIPLIAIDSADELIYAFDSGEISLVSTDVTGANALGFSSGYEEFRYPTTTMLYVGFQAKTGPCKSAAVRQILSRSFDRDTVADSLLAGHGDASTLPFPPCSALYSIPYTQQSFFDPDAAEALAQAGYRKGEDGLWYSRYAPLSLTFVVNTDNSFKLQIAEYLAQQLTSQGITVNLQKLPWEDYLAALENGAFDLYLGEVSLTADFDLTPLLAQKGTLNYGAYTNIETELLLAQLSAANEEQKSAAVAAMLEQFQSETPFAPLCFKSHSILTQWRCVSGLTPTRQNPFYQLESLRFDAVQ